MIGGRDAPSGTPARETALACIETGIKTGHPDRVLESRVALDGSCLRIADTTHDLAGFKEVVVLSPGKAAGGLAVDLDDLLTPNLH